ncbi:MAG: anthranilate phosphoribosyltransferase, partial [Frankiaceae bacterium]|nr:anthranilate phosphoribosyltransferase [Frankiaceae bacterium]
SQVWVVAGGEVRTERLDPSALGIAPASAEALRGADAAHNADVTRSFLAGEPGAIRDAVLLNAAAALVAYEGVGPGPVGEQVAAMLPRAASAVDSGAAAAVLDRWVSVSRALATP